MTHTTAVTEECSKPVPTWAARADHGPQACA